MSECIHLLDPATCTICNGWLKRDLSRRWSRPFPARYSSRCFQCGERIYEGQLICYDGDVAVHEDCG